MTEQFRYRVGDVLRVGPRDIRTVAAVVAGGNLVLLDLPLAAALPAGTRVEIVARASTASPTVEAAAGDGDGDGDGDAAVSGDDAMVLMALACGLVIVAVFLGTLLCQRKAATVKREAATQYKGELVQLEHAMSASKLQHASEVEELKQQLQEAVRAMQQERQERETMRERYDGGGGGLGAITEGEVLTEEELRAKAARKAARKLARKAKKKGKNRRSRSGLKRKGTKHRLLDGANEEGGEQDGGGGDKRKRRGTKHKGGRGSRLQRKASKARMSRLQSRRGSLDRLQMMADAERARRALQDATKVAIEAR